MLKNSTACEIMARLPVGVTKTSPVMGKHSGRAILPLQAGEMGRWATISSRTLPASGPGRPQNTSTTGISRRWSTTTSPPPTTASGSDRADRDHGTPRGQRTTMARCRGARSPGGREQRPIDAVFNAIAAIVPHEASWGSTTSIPSPRAPTPRPGHCQARARWRLGHRSAADRTRSFSPPKAYLSALNKLIARGGRSARAGGGIIAGASSRVVPGQTARAADPGPNTLNSFRPGSAPEHALGRSKIGPEESPGTTEIERRIAAIPVDDAGAIWHSPDLYFHLLFRCGRSSGDPGEQWRMVFSELDLEDDRRRAAGRAAQPGRRSSPACSMSSYVRHDRAGASADGLRSQCRDLLLGHRDAAVLHVITRGRLPSYLARHRLHRRRHRGDGLCRARGPNANIAVALGGIIIACGAVYALIRAPVVQAVPARRWIEALLPRLSPATQGQIAADRVVRPRWSRAVARS